MSIATADDVIAALAAGPQTINFYKTLNLGTANVPVSMWLGTPGAGSAAPAYTVGSGYTCSSATAGAIPFSNGAAQRWLARMKMMSSTLTGSVGLYDRLWSCSGMGFAAGTYAVTTPGNLPARITDNGLGVEMFVEQFVGAGAASGPLTLNSLDAATGAAQAGVIPAVVSAPAASRMQVIPHAFGVNGIRQVTSAVTSLTWTSGSFGITLAKKICDVPINSITDGYEWDWAKLGLPKIPNDACLMFICYGAASSTPLNGQFTIIDK
jgi:hypothetical protein